MVARDAEWMHNNPEHSDCDRMNADSHLRALLLGHNLTLQVSGGEVVLGQWQRILMAELDGPRARSLRIQIFGVSLTPASGVVSRGRARRPSPTSPTRLEAGRAPGARRRRPPVRGARPAGRRLAGQPRARAAPRRPHLLQPQHPPRGDERLRRELPVLLVRAAEAGRRRRVHDVARAGLGQAARSARTSRSPRSTSSTACIRTCRSTTTRSCCAASSGSAPTST